MTFFCAAGITLQVSLFWAYCWPFKATTPAQDHGRFSPSWRKPQLERYLHHFWKSRRSAFSSGNEHRAEEDKSLCNARGNFWHRSSPWRHTLPLDWSKHIQKGRGGGGGLICSYLSRRNLAKQCLVTADTILNSNSTKDSWVWRRNGLYINITVVVVLSEKVNLHSIPCFHQHCLTYCCNDDLLGKSYYTDILPLSRCLGPAEIPKLVLKTELRSGRHHLD